MEDLQFVITTNYYIKKEPHWLDDDGLPFLSPKEKLEAEIYEEWLMYEEDY